MPVRISGSRRAFVGSVVLALASAAARAGDEADEAEKIRKTDARYQFGPKGQQRCEICLQFNPPDACKIVQGPISPKGWCQYFAAREDAH